MWVQVHLLQVFTKGPVSAAAITGLTHASHASPMLRPDVFADAAMMIPDFSSEDKAINKKRSAVLEQLAEAASSAQSDKAQSRLHGALEQRNEQHDAAAPDSSKSDASQSPAVTEASQHTADEGLRSSTSTGATTTSGSESAGSGQQQAQEPAGDQSRKAAKVGQMTALWGGRGVVTGLLHPSLGLACCTTSTVTGKTHIDAAHATSTAL